MPVTHSGDAAPASEAGPRRQGKGMGVRFSVEPWEGESAAAYTEIADLWNRSARSRHAFFPWTGDLLSRHLAPEPAFPSAVFTARLEDGTLAGYCHTGQLLEKGYPRAGVVEMLLVDPRWRHRGIGTTLLRHGLAATATGAGRPAFVDALGAWPFGFLYNGLVDGSERSGVFLADDGLHRLLTRAGFQPVKKSLVMRADPAECQPRPLPAGLGFYIGRRKDNTWLDRVFRGRELWDHMLVNGRDGRVLSRAIFGLMEGESQHEGRAIFSLFGVNTPKGQQGNGYAGINLSHLMEYVRSLGGEGVELHVYTDNAPALALYARLGFIPVAETVMMHKRF